MQLKTSAHEEKMFSLAKNYVSCIGSISEKKIEYRTFIEGPISLFYLLD